MGDLSPHFYQSLVDRLVAEVSVCWHFQPTHTQAEAPGAQRAPGRAAGLPTVNHHALHSPLNRHLGAGQGEMGRVLTTPALCVHFLMKQGLKPRSIRLFEISHVGSALDHH